MNNSPAERRSPLGLLPGHPAPRLYDRVVEILRARHYSVRTPQTYCHWATRFIHFHNVRHPAEIAEPEINAFLTHLAVKERVSASSQNQALSALLFQSSQPVRRAVKSKGVMLMRIRRRDHKYEKAHAAEPEGVVAVVGADSTTCYKGQKLRFRILCGSI